MSEFLAEARILVRPDTSKFRAELEAQLKVATAKPLTIPIVPVVAGGGLSAATAQTGAFTTATTGAAAATQAAAAGMEKESIAALELANANKVATASTARLTQGAGSSALSLLGIRGATLAASSGFLAGAAAVTVFAKSVQSAASLETELNVFKVTAGATADQMDRVSESARQLGRDITLPGVTANIAAEAMTELAKAGLSVEDSLAGARGALQLSTAAQIGVKDATNLVAGALNSFGLAGTEAVKVADLLTGAAKESQGEITDMATALGQAAAVSNQFGVSIEDTVTLLTELAQAGISGGRAGTSLRVAFLRLVNPPADAAKALAELNVQIRDAQGNLRPEIFSDISDAIRGYTKAQQDATLATIFGSDAIRTAAIIGARGSAAFDITREAITEVGLAQEQAAARTSGLQGAMENLNNQLSSLGLAFGNAVKGPLTEFVNQLSDVVSGMNDAAEGSAKLVKSINEFAKSVDRALPFLGAFDANLGKIVKAGFLLNPLTGQFKALAEAGRLFGNNAEEATPKTDAYGNAIDGVGASLSALSTALLQSAADSKVFTQQVTADTQNLLQSAADSKVGSTKQVAPPPIQFPVKRIQNIVEGFNDKQVRDRIAGDNKKLLADLQAEQDFLIKELQKQGVKNRPALRRALEQALLGTVNEIETIQGQAASAADKVRSDAERAAREAAAAASAREKDLLNRLGVQRDQQQNKIAAAAQTAGLQDDINAQKGLKALVLKQIAAVKERISVEGGRAAVLAALKAILIQIDGQQRDISNQQRAALKQGINLDISFDQTIENKKKEVADREKLVKLLKKELAAAKKGTNAYKEIRNQIAEQNAAIKSIKGEQTDRVDLFQEAANQFTQFGSNIAARNGVLSGQDERAAFSKGVLDSVAKAQLTEAQKQTGWLERIAGNTAPIIEAAVWRKQTANLSTNPNAGGYKYSSGFAAKMAADNQYG